MANRLTKIVTRGGDGGETSLGDGTRVAKTDPRVGLLGEIDELNAWIGVVLSHDPLPEIAEVLEGVQHDLFDFGGALCFPGTDVLSDAHVARLDEASEKMNEGLPPLKEFILPGGAPILAWMHVARTTCRRIERTAIGFFSSDLDESPGAAAVPYLNRLSDLLFIAARRQTYDSGVQTTYWRKEKSINP